MKKCPSCQQEKEDHEFYGSAKLSSYCKSCTKLKQDQWRLDNPEKRLAINRSWVQKNTERRKMLNRASQAVFKAIERGVLIRPKACQKCGKTGLPIEAAHSDYSKLLDVQWLCKSCHRQWDSDFPKSI